MISGGLLSIAIFACISWMVYVNLWQVASTRAQAGAPPSAQDGTRLGPRIVVNGLESHSAPFFLPQATGLPSDVWRPTIYRECLPGMPKEWAPCKAFPNAEVAEEIVYPDYKILSPRLIDPSHAALMTECFVRKPHPNIRDKNYVHYLNQHGRNFIFTNTSYSGVPRASWGPEACMGDDMVKVDVFSRRASNAVSSPNTHDTVMFAASPDSYSFQHFMDRVTVMLTQTLHLRAAKTLKFMTLTPRDDSVSKLWKVMANASRSDLIAPSQMTAGRFLMACDAPLWHPFNTQKTAETILKAAGASGMGVARPMRKVIAALPRADGTERNGGRRWLNYESCTPNITDLLKTRGQGEELRQFRLSDFPSFDAAIRFWNENVRLAIGVHGGGLYNTIWSSDDTVIVELRPRFANRTYGGTLFWELAAMKNLTYWTVPVPAINNMYDANIDCGLVIDILKAALSERKDERGPVLDTWYQGGFAPGL